VQSSLFWRDLPLFFIVDGYIYLSLSKILL
jgi:hypothetical protein